MTDFVLLSWEWFSDALMLKGLLGNVFVKEILDCLVFLMTLLILATAVTILAVSATLSLNSRNWVVEALSQKMSLHIIDNVREPSQT